MAVNHAGSRNEGFRHAVEAAERCWRRGEAVVVHCNEGFHRGVAGAVALAVGTDGVDAQSRS